jgi:xylulokinase
VPSAETVLSVDLGTTFFKAAIMDRNGEMRGLGRVSVERNGQGGICELPVERFWGSLRNAVDQALEESGARVESIRAVSYSSQANSFILLDRRLSPLTPMILWPDRRASDLRPEPRIEDLWGRADFLSRTGLGMYAVELCLAKLIWFQRERPETWADCTCIQSISDFLVFSLTGRRVGDQGTAALLGLWDLSRRSWWREALRAAGTSREMLSKPLPPGARAGFTTAGAKTLLGLPAGIPLAVGTLDHHAAAIGAGIRSLEVPCVSIGTVLACMRYRKELGPMPGCVCGPGTHGYPYYVLAFENNGTAAIDRHRTRRHPDVPVEKLLAMGENAPIGSNGLMVRPTSAGSKEESGGAFDSYDDGAVVRALMESSAASLLNLIQRLYPDSPPNRAVGTGGGARSRIWPRLFADVCGIEFEIPRNAEAACLGAGMLAAVAADWFDTIAEATDSWSSPGAVIRPNPAHHAAYQRWIHKYRDWVARQPSGGASDLNSEGG